ncbi:MAG: protease inhibitor I42 family protein [Clostridia bacterium]|nr:protease inhibitor I42 family protein [Clostridia bacterium]
MTNLISLILAALMCFMGTANCFVGSGETPEEPPQTVTLRYESFDGGGYEFSVKIDDPEVLGVRMYRDYGEVQGELPPGAPFYEVFVFEGIKAGKTMVSIYAFSPIIDSREMIYEATVDEALNVTFAAEKKITRLELYRYGSEKPRNYELITLQDEYCLSVDGSMFLRKLSAPAADELNRLAETYDLIAWDGFDGHGSGVLDGEGFRLDIWFSDGTEVHASGDNAFPPGYFDAINDLEDILANG